MRYFAGLLTHKLALRTFVHEEHQVAGFYLVVATRDDCLHAPADGHHTVAVVVEETRCETFVQDGCTFPHFHCTQLQFPARQLQAVSHPVSVKRLANLFRRQYLRVYQVIQTYVFEDALVLRLDVLVVVYPSQRTSGT